MTNDLSQDGTTRLGCAGLCMAMSGATVPTNESMQEFSMLGPHIAYVTSASNMGRLQVAGVLCAALVDSELH